MIHTLTIETHSDADFALVSSLAKRIGLGAKETHTETPLSKADDLRLLDRVAGGWQGEESGQPPAALLQNARSFRFRNADL